MLLKNVYLCFAALGITFERNFDSQQRAAIVSAGNDDTFIQGSHIDFLCVADV